MKKYVKGIGKKMAGKTVNRSLANSFLESKRTLDSKNMRLKSAEMNSDVPSETTSNMDFDLD